MVKVEELHPGDKVRIASYPDFVEEFESILQEHDRILTIRRVIKGEYRRTEYYFEAEEAPAPWLDGSYYSTNLKYIEEVVSSVNDFDAEIGGALDTFLDGFQC